MLSKLKAKGELTAPVRVRRLDADSEKSWAIPPAEAASQLVLVTPLSFWVYDEFMRISCLLVVTAVGLRESRRPPTCPQAKARSAMR